MYLAFNLEEPLEDFFWYGWIVWYNVFLPISAVFFNTTHGTSLSPFEFQHV